MFGILKNINTGKKNKQEKQEYFKRINESEKIKLQNTDLCNF